MRKKKKIISLYMLILILSSIIPTAVATDNHFTQNDLGEVRSTIIQSTEYANYVNYMMSYHILSSASNYRVERNLKNGSSVVFFFEGCSDNVRTPPYNDTSKYRISAYCAVVKLVNGKPQIVFESENCSTLPDNPRKDELNNGAVPTVVDGIYNIRMRNHLDDYAALNIVDNSNSSVPVIRCTRTTTDLIDTSSGINIHARSLYTSNPNGITSVSKSSTGCFNVGLSTDNYKEYNQFIKVITGVSNAKNSKYSTEYKDMGIVIVDRYNYQSQLKAINEQNCIVAQN